MIHPCLLAIRKKKKKGQKRAKKQVQMRWESQNRIFEVKKIVFIGALCEYIACLSLFLVESIVDL